MTLAHLTHDQQVAAIMTASPKAIHSAAATLRQSARKTISRAGGRPPIIRECPRCLIRLPTAKMRSHKCPKDPA